jgi:hypothetical protein
VLSGPVEILPKAIGTSDLRVQNQGVFLAGGLQRGTEPRFAKFRVAEVPE